MQKNIAEKSVKSRFILKRRDEVVYAGRKTAELDERMLSAS